jgi:acetyl esterase
VSGPFADAQLEEFVRQASAPSGPLDAAAMREGSAQRARLRPRGPEMHEVRELRIGKLSARLYRPAVASGLIVYLHGGGWTIGSLDSHDRACRMLAAGSGAQLLAVDYRLAPEHPWPASVDDAVTALRWVSQGPAELEFEGPLAVAGDSAGGTLAALVCLRLRDEHPEALPDLQALLCPNTDLAGTHPSMREKAVGWGLDAEAVRFFNSQWVADEREWSNPGVSPLRAPDLHGLPPALIVTAEHDVLRDEGEAYAERLREAGVSTHLRREPGLVHNFLMLDYISPACADAVERLTAGLRTRLGTRDQSESSRSSSSRHPRHPQS